MVGKGNPGQIRPASWEKPSDLLNTRVPVVFQDLIYVGSVWGTLEGAMPHPKGKTASWLHTLQVMVTPQMMGKPQTMPTPAARKQQKQEPGCKQHGAAEVWVLASCSCSPRRRHHVNCL